MTMMMVMMIACEASLFLSSHTYVSRTYHTYIHTYIHITGWYALDSANKVDKSEVRVSYLYLPFQMAEALSSKAEELYEDLNAAKTPRVGR